ncbi:protein-ADP-ribose hydrolase [Streptomyces canus]|uniref:protein-ADP-ribose hydrolase n=1 Tax=Streptomyces canus TaxID=58343 RepID=UPI0036B33471
MAATHLDLNSYRTTIALDQPFRPSAQPVGPQQQEEAARTALAGLLRERATDDLGMTPDSAASLTGEQTRRALRAVLNVRGPGPRPEGVDEALDALLGGERETRDIADAAGLATIAETYPSTGYAAAGSTVLWQGDIITLSADAVVNAANSQMLGCFLPLHACIDNALHSAAGPRLRDDCATIMALQGRAERTGDAKITRGYQLPARNVLHTVGPVVSGALTAGHERLLAQAYRSCLEVAAERGDVRSVAFCSISTGVFGFPKLPAARIALATVSDWMAAHPVRLDRVVFNVWSEADLAVYVQALTEER